MKALTEKMKKALLSADDYVDAHHKVLQGLCERELIDEDCKLTPLGEAERDKLLPPVSEHVVESAKRMVETMREPASGKKPIRVLDSAHAQYMCLVQARRLFQDFCEGYDVSLVSGNQKTGYSDNHLHGSSWSSEYVEGKLRAIREKPKYARFRASLEPFMEEHGTPHETGGSCEHEVIESCFFGGEHSSTMPKGHCYCNAGHFVDPRTFFLGWMRYLYYAKHPVRAFSLLGLEVRCLERLGEISGDRPFRLNGQGDTLMEWVPYIAENFMDIPHLVSGFVRNVDVWLELLSYGFCQVALSVDHTLLERPRDLLLLKNRAPAWGSVVFGPLDKQEQFDTVESLGLRIRVYFRRHFSGRITNSALDIEGVRRGQDCPTYFDKMRLRSLYDIGQINKFEFVRASLEDVRTCFQGCKRCHAVPSDVLKEAMEGNGLNW